MPEGARQVITVFGGPRPAPGSEPYETARRLGAALAGVGFRVASGGYGGAMEGVSRGAHEAGGKTIGVTAAVFRSQANPWVEEEIRVATWEGGPLEAGQLGGGCGGGAG